MDRTNDQVAFFEHDHPTIWKLIQHIQDVAQKANIEVRCGELASTLLGASGLIGLGIRNLSMKPSSILSVKNGFITIHYHSMNYLVQK